MCEISIGRESEHVSHFLLSRRPGFIGFLSFLYYYWTRCRYLLRNFLFVTALLIFTYCLPFFSVLVNVIFLFFVESVTRFEA